MWMAIAIRRLIEGVICFVVAMFVQVYFLMEISSLWNEWEPLWRLLVIPSICAVLGPIWWDYQFRKELRTGR
jgi:hypothetical protein